MSSSIDASVSRCFSGSKAWHTIRGNRQATIATEWNMSDKFLQKYTRKSGDQSISSAATDEPEIADDLGAFGWLRGRDRAIMLELRTKNGNIVAVGYSWLERVEFDPSEGIMLHMVGQKIRIRGRNLNSDARPNVRLFQGITRHKVPWIQEADEPAELQAGKSATFIEMIDFG